MLPPIVVFHYLDQDKIIVESDIDFFDTRLTSFCRDYYMLGYIVKNFQDHSFN